MKKVNIGNERLIKIQFKKQTKEHQGPKWGQGAAGISEEDDCLEMVLET